jgi:hypothetical protein
VFSDTLQHFCLGITARWLSFAVEAGWLRLEPGDGAGIWTDEIEAVLKRLGPTRPDPTRPDPTRPDPTRPDPMIS